MIKLEINTKQLVEELDRKISGMKEMTSPSVLQEISKAVFTITGERFMVSVDNYARRNPKKMHHLYEWGQIGNPSKRLFVLERSSILNGTLVASTKFLPSKMPVPISPELLRRGASGKSVTRRNIFANKAFVMETGSQVRFTAKRTLAFMGNNGITFIKPGTQVNILRPGGIATKDALGTYMYDWYIKNGNSIMESSGFYEKIEEGVSKVLSNNGAGISAVKSEISRIANSISMEKKVIK